MTTLGEENRTTAHDDSTQSTLGSNISASESPSTDVEEPPVPVPVTRRVSRASSTGESLGRVRSYNAYGCDSDVEWEDMGLPREGEVRDPFLVGWEGPDDPMNPRSRSLAVKWIIVLINSSAALCV
jgi:hypothetical protein